MNIIIPTINRSDLLVELLLSLDAQISEIDKILIIDNGNQNIHLEKYSLELNQKTTIYIPGNNLGVASSWNYGLRQFRNKEDYPWTLILNDDIVLDTNQIQKIKKELESQFSDKALVVGTFYWSVFAINQLNCPLELFINDGDIFDGSFYPAYFEDNDLAYRISLINPHLAYYGWYGMKPSIERNSMTIKKNPSLNNNFHNNKIRFIQKWGGAPTTEQFKDPFNHSERIPLTIISPCSRISNIEHLRYNIIHNDKSQYIFRWLLILDKSKIDQNDSKLQAELKWLDNIPGFEYYFYNNEGSISGNSQRNFGLSLVNAGWVYFLDDDNVIHQNYFTQMAKLIRQHPNKKGIITNQVHKDGLIRLAASLDIGAGKTDTAQFTIHSSLIGDTKWIEHDYCADGYFIKELYDKDPDAFLIVNENLSYYNFLEGVS